ncbi:polysaccharide biosynthesis C-terminal domain-containing protein [uncultured Lacticaseibacillus sp.]|uniref:oligosaccharide flippase family protein n=1 Tax=uncultured Lacticaseibacillus sp. TaxID=2775882 RepID=UPI002596584B|nr:polysaccharide biosynthesis C-terminal domain-containing protein [uncultured Lacticaseibacillus sp.]
MNGNNSRKLISNLVTFAIGNLGSKLISFILIPIFTRYLSPDAFGQVDLITTTVNMLLPITALSIADAVFRFVMDHDANVVSFFSTGISFTMLMCMVAFAVAPLLQYFGVEFPWLIVIYLCLGLIQALLQNFIRGIGLVRLFALNGLLSSILLACFGIFEIVYLRNGVQGYLLALILATFFSVLFLISVAHLWKYFDVRLISRLVLGKMLLYSVPLIPNAFFWFFTNDASRFFIVYFVGLSANGIYAVATKIPTILNVFYTIFSQAWQISAVDELGKKDSPQFFSKVFNLNISMSVVLIGGILVFIQPIMRIYAAKSFFSAWEIIPSLLIAAFFSNLSSFLGTVYLATKRTSGIMKTTIYGMLVNVVLNLILIPLLGIQGAGIGAAIGFAFVTFIRLLDTRKVIHISVNWENLVISGLFILTISAVQLLHVMSGALLYVTLFSLELLLVVISVFEYKRAA